MPALRAGQALSRAGRGAGEPAMPVSSPCTFQTLLQVVGPHTVEVTALEGSPGSWPIYS